MLCENLRRIAVNLFKALQISEAAVLINGGVLIVLAISRRYLARSWDMFNVNLKALPGIGHLLIRLRDISGRFRFSGRHKSFSDQHPIEADIMALVTPVPQLEPELHQSQILVRPPHISDQLQLFFLVTVWMMMGFSRSTGQRS
jgi:hypothetical protein